MDHKAGKNYQSDAKGITDAMFNAKLFKENFTRDDLAAVEDYIALCLQSRFKSYQQLNALLKSLEKTK